MALEFKETISWQTAIELSSKLTDLAEQLPKSDHPGLATQLQTSLIDLPTAIAMDLGSGGTNRLMVVARLTSLLEVIEKIYPALDVATCKNELGTLVDRITGDDFSERKVVESLTATAVDHHDDLPVSLTPADEHKPENEPHEGEVVAEPHPPVPAGADNPTQPLGSAGPKPVEVPLTPPVVPVVPLVPHPPVGPVSPAGPTPSPVTDIKQPPVAPGSDVPSPNQPSAQGLHIDVQPNRQQ